MRKIDADALVYNDADYAPTGKWIRKEDIDAAPEADEKAHWIMLRPNLAKCSACGGWEHTNGKDMTMTGLIFRAVKKYCPNCGRRMNETN